MPLLLQYVVKRFVSCVYDLVKGMSALVRIDSIPLEKRKKMLGDLHLRSTPKPGKSSKYAKPVEFDLYEIVEDDYVTVPFAYAFHNLGIGYPNPGDFGKMQTKFNLPLLERQKEIRDETFSILNEYRSILLSLRTGWGKSPYAIYLACKIGLKTLIYDLRIVLTYQWVDVVKNVCGEEARVQIVTATSEIDMEADFYVMNASVAPKRHRMDFSHVGTLIADEADTLCTEKYSRSLNFVFPKYSIALTATPERSDGQDRVLELYFGPNSIERKLYEVFNVYTIPSSFVPKIKKNSNGDMQWDSVLTSQGRSMSRNTLIVDVVRYFCKRKILILCKRKEQALLLAGALRKYKEDVDVYMGSQKCANYDSRVLVVTCSKSGRGFNHPKLDMLIPAADTEENWVQYAGRIFRREHHAPIIVEISDKFGPLKKHLETRLDVCRQSGAEVKFLHRSFPNFYEWRKRFSTDISSVYDEMNIEDS